MTNVVALNLITLSYINAVGGIATPGQHMTHAATLRHWIYPISPAGICVVRANS